MNIFEIATKNKFRFEFKGNISTEDLWDLKRRDLDTIYKKLNSQVKKDNEPSLEDARSKADETLDSMIKVVAYIHSVKKEQEVDAKLAKAKSDRKQRLLELKERKLNMADEELTAEEIEELLKDLD